MVVIITPVNGPVMPGELPAGEDLDIPFDVARYLNAQESEVTNVRISIFWFDNAKTKNYVEDRDGTTIQNVQVTDVLNSPGTLFFRYKSKKSQTPRLYFAEWTAEFRGETMPASVDRFRIVAETKGKGDVEFGSPQRVS